MPRAGTASRAIQRKILIVQPEPPPNAPLKQRMSYETVVTSAKNIQERLATRTDKAQRHEDILTEADLTAGSLSSVTSAEKIYIVAHGDGALVGKKTPQQLAALLVTTAGLRAAKEISVYACLSHYQEDGAVQPQNTYTGKLVTEIRNLLATAPGLTGVNVKGRAGFVHALATGTRVRATNKAEVTAVLTDYSDCGKTYRERIEEYKAFATEKDAEEWAYADYKECMAERGEVHKVAKDVSLFAKKDTARSAKIAI